MPDIVFNEQTHEYFVDDKKYPSVTQILDLLTYTEFANIDKGVLESASRRGTAIHEATENLDYGGYAEVDAETEPYVQAYMDFSRDYIPDWYGVEEQVFNKEHGFCGTIDRHGMIGNTPCVLDIKTIASPNRLTYVKVCLQTYLYSLCLDYENPRLFALFLRKDGKYRLFDCRAWWSENMHDQLWQSARDILSAYKAIQRIKEKDIDG